MKIKLIRPIRPIRPIFFFLSAILVALAGIFVYSYFFAPKVQAAWWDDSWAFRKSIAISTHTAAENNVYINLTGANDIDTSDTTKFQTDCGDLRFTKENGELLPYYIASDCSTTDTVIHVQFDAFPAGAQTIYYYYGNPSAPDGFSSADFSTEASNYTLGSQGSEEKSNGPIAYWSFNDGQGQTAQDSTTNNNDGTLGADSGSSTDDPTWITEDQCISGKCLKFDGSNDYVDAGDKPSFDITGSLTLSYWVKLNSNTTSQLILGKDIDAYVKNANFRTRYSYWNSEQKFTFDVGDGTNGIELKTVNAYSDLGKWYFISAVWDTSTKTARIYINGNLENSQTNNNMGSLITNDNSFQMGRLPSTGLFLKGFLDEVKIYPYARTAAQIKADFTKASSAEGSSAVLGAKDQSYLSDGLVGYWKMDETSGTAVADASGNSNTGTLTSAQETGTGEAEGTTTTLVDADNADLSTTDDVYNNMILRITGGGGCGIDTGTERIISDYTGSSKTITVGTAFAAETDSCTFEIRHQVSGKYGNGVQFDGTDDYVNVPSSDSLNIGAKDFAISTWYYPYSLNDYAGPWMKNYQVNRIIIRSSGSTYAQLQNASGVASNIGIGEITSVVNTWQHILLTYNHQEQKARIYYNGDLKDTVSLSGGYGTQSDGQSFNIGTNQWYFNGVVDETRIYNRAFSPKEVSDLYNFAPGPTGYWDFEDGTGSTVTDKSGGGYNGTFAGTGPYWVDGKYGKSGNFVNTDNKVPTTLSINTFRQGTISMWVKELDLSGGNYAYLVSSANVCNKGMPIVKDNVNMRYISQSSDQSISLNTGDNSLVMNTWQYLTVIWNSSGAYFYINGILKSSDTAVDFSDLSDWNTNVLIGSQNINCGGTNNPNKHLIDEVKVYNYARTQKQIIEDMNGGHPAVGSPVGSAVGYWKFDEGYSDTANNSGSGGGTYNGTLTNMASPATSTSGWTQSGNFDKALNFDGSNDFVNTSLTINNNLSQTYSAWVNTRGTGVNQRIISQGVVIGDSYLRINANATLSARWGGGDEVASTQTLLENQWYHVVATWDGTSGIKLYINGKLAASGTGGSSSMYSTSDFVRIGTYTAASPTTEPFNGAIDDVKVYNHALTADEVKTEYNRGSSLVLGAAGNNSTYQPGAANQEYCVPGDTSSCAAPVGEWKFEEKVTGNSKTVFDTSGNNNTGTTNWGANTSGMNCNIVGKYGGACSFDGTDDYISVTDLGTSVLDLASNGTWEGWFYLNNNSSTQSLINKDNYPTAGGYSLYISNTGKLGLYIAPTAVTSTTTITTGTWHHLAATKSGTTVIFYLDGIYDGTGTVPSSIPTNNLSIGLGAKVTGPTEYFNGKLDEVKIYNYARSAAQIAWDYNRGKPVGYWDFDECQGTQVYDSSGNGNHGTITIGASGEDTLGTCNTSSTAWGSGATGKRNTSISLDGIDDYVSATDNATLDLGDTVSVAAWVKRGVINGNEHVILNKGVDTYMLKLDGSGYPTFGSYGIANIARTSRAITDTTTWHHIVATKNGSTTKIYLDGQDLTVAIDTDTLGNNATNLLIGAGSTGVDYPFNGQIDDVRIFNYALTAQQVKTEYNGGAVNFGPVTGSP